MKIEVRINQHGTGVYDLPGIDEIASCPDIKLLNSGQGEGQMQIHNSVWGYYLNNPPEFVLEEGVLSWQEFSAAFEIIAKRYHELSDAPIEIVFVGEHSGDEYDKFLPS